MKHSATIMIFSMTFLFTVLGITTGCAATKEVAVVPVQHQNETFTELNTEAEILQNSGSCLPKWGPDSIETIKNVSLYGEFIKQNNFTDALPYWRYVFTNAPGARQSTFVDGAKMFNDLIKKEKDAALKEKYIDTLMLIYDKRLECFGQKGEVIGRQAIELMNHRPDQNDEIYEKLDKSVKLDGNKTKSFIVYPYMFAAVKSEKGEKISKDEIMNIYQKVSGIIDANIKLGGKTVDDWKSIQKQVDDLMSGSGYFDCESLKPVMQRLYDGAPDDKETLQKIFNQLRSARCATDPLFVKVSEKLYKIEPDVEKARILALNFSNMGNYQQAEFYFKEAARLETDGDAKADYLMSLADLRYRADDYPGARTYALQAAAAKPNWGKPYLLIGDMYRGSGKKCGTGTGWDSQVVTWPAMDMYEKAKSVDPSVAGTANQKINDTKQYMPSAGECFFRNLKEGDSFKVNCWINETTTVRYGPDN